MKTVNSKKILIFITAILFINLSSLIAGEDTTGVTSWESLGSGINGEVRAITKFNGLIIAAGGFQTAGGLTVDNIAAWDGSNWSPLGNGMNDSVNALAVYNGELIAAGNFTNASGVANTNRIARWDGSQWAPLGNGINNQVRALIVFNGELIAGGEFSNVGQNIAKWNGNSWTTLGTGVDDDVYAFTIFENDLIAGGKFEQAGGTSALSIARWNGSTWSALPGSTFDDRIFSLAVYNNELFAGGRFETSGTVNAPFLAKYTGLSWVSVGGGVEDRIYSMSVYNDKLIVGGQLKFAYNAQDTVNAYRIGAWDGSVWENLSTGFDDKVITLYSDESDTSLYTGGEFSTAGGRIMNGIARWGNVQTVIVEGVVINNMTGNPVNGGYVKVIRLDLNTRQVLTVDSTQINPSDGTYSLRKVRIDSSYVIAFPNDIIENDFVPTYYPSTIHWEDATRLNITGNISGLQIVAFRANIPIDNGSQQVNPVSGKIMLNYLPFGFLTGAGLPFKSDAIVYLRQGNIFPNYAVSNRFEGYEMPSVASGEYKVIVNRMGYASDSIDLVISGMGNDSVNFVLDTVAYSVDIKTISTQIPQNFKLHQNYPNPFNPITYIKFDLISKSTVTLEVFDIAGRKITTFAENVSLDAGTYGFSFNASAMSSGVYFYRMSVNDALGNSFFETRKMILVR